MPCTFFLCLLLLSSSFISIQRPDQLCVCVCGSQLARADDGFVAHLVGFVTFILPRHCSEPSSAQSCCRFAQVVQGTRRERLKDKQRLSREQKPSSAKVKCHLGMWNHSAEFLCRRVWRVEMQQKNKPCLSGQFYFGNIIQHLSHQSS